jgi:hypothetical protein
MLTVEEFACAGMMFTLLFGLMMFVVLYKPRGSE